MAFYYQKGNIDVDNYSFGVISDIGCLSIIITSEDLFAIFADKVYNENKESEDEINSAWANNITKITSGTPEASIGKLINFFNDVDAGVSVMFRPMSSDNTGNHQGENWIAKSVNENGEYTNKNCK